MLETAARATRPLGSHSPSLRPSSMPPTPRAPLTPSYIRVEGVRTPPPAYTGSDWELSLVACFMLILRTCAPAPPSVRDG